MEAHTIATKRQPRCNSVFLVSAVGTDISFEYDSAFFTLHYITILISRSACFLHSSEQYNPLYSLPHIGHILSYLNAKRVYNTFYKTAKTYIYCGCIIYMMISELLKRKIKNVAFADAMEG